MDDLAGVKAVDLRSGLQAYVEKYWDDPGNGATTLSVAEVPKDYFDDESPACQISFRLRNDQLHIEISFTSFDYLSKDDELRQSIPLSKL